MGRWEGIYEFIQVVDAGGFSAAAARMGRSNSQVSKLIARLEDRLGVRLLNRTTRRLTLTDEGEQFYHRCKRVVEAFDSAEQDVSAHRNEPRGILKINVGGLFPEHFIVPLLARFLADHPHLQIDLAFTEQRVDLIEQGCDLGICQGQLADSSLVARKLLDSNLQWVAHPGYLARHGVPQTPDDLQRHNCLVGGEATWSFDNGRERGSVKVRGNWRSNSAAALVLAARSSVGVALLPGFAVAADIAAGALLPVLPSWSRREEPVWAVYPHTRHLSAKVRLFVNYLAEHFADHAAPLSP
jgi:DNA-binding transcriptional LysR family regulator